MAMEWQSEGIRMCEELSPKPGQLHTHTVVFLHGRGDTAANFKQGITHNTWADSSARSPIDMFPTFRWVFPTAGMKPCARPGSPPSMSQWFDIWDHLNFRNNEMLQQPGLRESVDRVRALVAHEAAQLGGRYDKIILMGISQGGATSVHTLLNLGFPDGYAGPKRLGALVGVSCRLPFPGRSLQDTRQILGLGGVCEGNEVLRNTPVLLEHCVDDPTVLFEGGEQLKGALREFGASVEMKAYPEGGHWFKSPEGPMDLAEFLVKFLPKD
ncbi:unnamed protein product [Discula destructiva]